MKSWGDAFLTPSTCRTLLRMARSMRKWVGSPERSAVFAFDSACWGTTRISAPRRWAPMVMALSTLLSARVAVKRVHDTTATMARSSQDRVRFRRRFLSATDGMFISEVPLEVSRGRTAGDETVVPGCEMRPPRPGRARPNQRERRSIPVFSLCPSGGTAYTRAGARGRHGRLSP